MRFHLRQTVPSTSRNSLIDNHFHSTPPITSAKLHDSPNPCKQPPRQANDPWVQVEPSFPPGRWSGSEGAPSLAQVMPFLGAGGDLPWRRCDFALGTCAAKWGSARCGGAGLAPISTPAPATSDTCASDTRYQRQQPARPAPTPPDTCATDTLHSTCATVPQHSRHLRQRPLCLPHQHSPPSLHLMNLARNLCNGSLHSPYNQPLTLSAPENKKSTAVQSC